MSENNLGSGLLGESEESETLLQQLWKERLDELQLLDESQENTPKTDLQARQKRTEPCDIKSSN